MTALALEIVKLEFEALKLKKMLIEKYSGFDDSVSQIIVNESRIAINQIQESIKYFSTH